MTHSDLSKLDRNTDPAYAKFREEAERFHGLNRKVQPLRARETELASSLIRPKSPDDLTAAADGFDDDENNQLSELLGRPTNAGLRRELQDVRHDLRIINVAIEKQREYMDAAEKDAAEKVRARLLGAHQSLARTIVDRLKGLRDALQAEKEFRHDLDDKQIGWGMPLQPASFTIIGTSLIERIEACLAEFQNGYGRYQIS